MKVQLLEQVIDIAYRAGSAIIKIYSSDDFAVEQKTNGDYDSPLTSADKTSHKIIYDQLKKNSNLPIISEEGNGDYQTYEKYWLVDPLDGTKDFISKNGEFTVNIALIEDKKPVLGVVYAPAIDKLYAADDNKVFMIENSTHIKLPIDGVSNVPRIVVSRNHKGEKLEKILKKFGPHKKTDVGSSLKFCLLAEGKAEVYPRFVPTYLWDTAAADAILRATGGEIRSLAGEQIVYDPLKNIKNPLFIATAKNQKKLYDKFLKLSSNTDNI